MTAPETHAWMPISACTSQCIDGDGERVGWSAVGVRVAGIVGVLTAYPVALLMTKGGRTGIQRRFARVLLRRLGMQVRVIDLRTDAPADARFTTSGRGTLVVAGHVGWTDILAIAAVQPVRFVGRADLARWPVIGRLASITGFVPIERSRLRELPGVVSGIGARLEAGECVAAFPEGTTWCGRSHGRMRPALFQAAIDAGVPVSPVALRYLGTSGEATTVAGFVGDDTMLGSAVRLLRSRGVVAEVVLLPTEQPGSDRRELAVRCERAVRGYDVPEPISMALDSARHRPAMPRPTAQPLVAAS